MSTVLPERLPVLVYGRTEVHAAVSRIPQVRIDERGDQRSKSRLRLTISGGISQLARVQDAGWWGYASEVVHHDAGATSRVLRKDKDMNRKHTPRGKTLGWERHSRNLMLKRFSTLDYRPLFADGERPALVTLTMPGVRWDEVVPDGRTFKRIIERFLRRYAHAWGDELAGIWKMEFQRRGAPHLHILMTPPRGRTRATGQSFPEWLAGTWAELCKLPNWDGTDNEHVQMWRDHAVHGTSINFEEGLRGWDPVSVAEYFSKHGVFADKDYQNEAPELWIEAGSVGRFWGYWRLGNGEVTIDLPDEGTDGPDGGTRPPAGPAGSGGGYGAQRERDEIPHYQRSGLPARDARSAHT